MAFACCIVVSFLLNCRFTFGVRPTWARLFRYPLSNLTTFLVMTVGVTVLVEVSGVDPGVAALVVAVLTVPVTFVVARLLLVGRLRADPPTPRR